MNANALAVYMPKESCAEAVRMALAGNEYNVAATWERFGRLISNTTAGVAIIPVLSESELTELARVRQHYPSCPLILATDGRADNLRKLAYLPPINHVVFTNDIPSRLDAVISAAKQAGIRCLASQTIHASLPPKSVLASVLAKACSLPAPVRTVHALARRVGGFSEAWLRKRWHVEIGRETSPRDFLWWLLTLNACCAWRVGETTTALARRLAVAPDVLAGSLFRTAGTRNIVALVEKAPDVVLDSLMRVLNNRSVARSPR